MSDHATSFFRVDCDLTLNVRVRRAAALLAHGCGGDAVLIYLAVLAEHKRHGQTGRIDAAHAELDAFGFPLIAMGIPVERLAAALEACCKTGLLERDDDGGLKLVGWDDFWRTGKTSTQRSRDRRQRQTPDDAPERNGRATAMQRDATVAPEMQRPPFARSPVQSSPVQSSPVQSSPVQSSPVQSSQVKSSPSSPTPPEPDPPTATKEDGPIEDALEQDLRKLGVVSPKHIRAAARNLREYPDPAAVLEFASRHCQRFADSTPALLATILGDKQQVALMLREASQKADNDGLRKRIDDLVAGMKLKLLSEKARTA